MMDDKTKADIFNSFTEEDKIKLRRAINEIEVTIKLKGLRGKVSDDALGVVDAALEKFNRSMLLKQ